MRYSGGNWREGHRHWLTAFPIVLAILITLAGCGGEVSDAGGVPETGEEDWTQYPLRRDDPRAKLDPKWMNVPPAAEPVPPDTDRTARTSTSSPSRHVRYVVATASSETLLDGAGGGTGAIRPEADLFAPSNQGLVEAPQSEDSLGGVGTSQEPLVFGDDNRVGITNTTLWPYRTVAKLFSTWPNGSSSGCSGAVVDEKAVLTAGHCVYKSSKGGWATSVTVVPGLSGQYMPFGQAFATRLDSVEGWTEDENNDYDYALVTIDRKIGRGTGWQPLCSLSDGSWDGQHVNVHGYPGSWGGLAMAGSSGSVANYDSTMIYHFADTTDGESGASLIPWGQGSEYACAVHSGSGYYWGWEYNAATRITNARFYQIYGWIDANYGLGEAFFPNDANWINLGGASVRGLTATSSRNGRYWDLFLADMWNGGVYHKAFDGLNYIPQTGYTYLGGYTEQSPAAVSRAPGLLDVFIRDPRPGSPGIYTKAWNGSAWVPSSTGWWYLGEPAASSDGPTVVSAGSNRLNVFTRTGDGNVWSRAWNGSWGSWQNIGGPAVYPVAAVSRATNLIDVFVQGPGGQVLTKAWNGSQWLPSQSGWWNLGGSIQEQPTVVAPASNRLDVFGRGLDNAIWTISWQGSWGSWISLGGQTTAPIAAVSRASGRYDIFMRDGRDQGGIFTKSWNGSAWWPSQTGWWNLGGNVYDVAVTSSETNRLDVFTRRQNDNVGWRYWNGYGWWP